MGATIVRTVVAVMLLAGVGVLAQEAIPTPAPVEPAKVDVGVKASTPTTNVPAAEAWRYRWYGGRWWYWTPDNRWMWHRDDGSWIEYHPDVPVVVRPYGNVSVGVGRRIGVNVWGPHGEVRVGRIYVGW